MSRHADVAYRQLTRGEQVRFNRIGVFEGPFDGEVLLNRARRGLNLTSRHANRTGEIAATPIITGFGRSPDAGPEKGELNETLTGNGCLNHSERRMRGESPV